MNHRSPIAIVGAGPSGLFCAEQLLKEGYPVDLFDQSSGIGKKFLIAGNGGLNLTHSEEFTIFKSRYGKDENIFQNLLKEFSPTDLRNWCEELGVETFIGTSGRIFPKGLKAADILLKWIAKLKSYSGFKMYLNHRLIDIKKNKSMIFKSLDTEFKIQAEIIILCLGGASWSKTGSDGQWAKLLTNMGVKLNKFLPMNCGFEREWSLFFQEKLDRFPLKNIKITLNEHSIRSELMLTAFGVEGSGIYALSSFIRDQILSEGKATISIDLRPDMEIKKIIEKLKCRKKKMTLSNHLRKSIGIDKSEFILLKEILKTDELENIEVLAKKIKNLEIDLLNTRPIDEAISTSGGVLFSELTPYLELKSVPGIYFAGEMLDFEAPTGGYLIQASFSSAFAVVKGILLKSLKK